MQNDRTTLKDLSIFTSDSGGGVFGLIDNTTTVSGRDVLRKYFYSPPDSFEALRELQDAVKFWPGNEKLWPSDISNGTMLMLEKFFESADSAAPPKGISLSIGSFLQKIFNRNEYFFTEFSLSHIADFLRGCQKLAAIKEEHECPALLQRELEAMQGELDHRLTESLVKLDKRTPYSELSRLCYRARRENEE